MPLLLDRAAQAQPRSMPVSPRSHAITIAFTLASLLAMAPACNDVEPESMDDGSSGDDSGSEGDSGSDGGSGADETGTDDGSTLPEICPAGPAPTMNAQGILTHYPSQSWLLGSSDLVPVSVNYVVTEGSFPLLDVYVEVRNDGDTACAVFSEMYIDGREVLGTIKASAYDDGYSDVTSECIGPGGFGVFAGFAEGISEADLEASTSVSFELDPYISPGLLPAIEPVVADPSVEMLDDGRFAFTATLLPARTIWNHGLTVYPKDAHGLVFDRLFAFPNELETLEAGSSWPIETLGTSCPFDDYRLYQSWIEGVAMGVVPPTEDSHSEYRHLVQQRRLRMDEIRNRHQASSGPRR